MRWLCNPLGIAIGGPGPLHRGIGRWHWRPHNILHSASASAGRLVASCVLSTSQQQGSTRAGQGSVGASLLPLSIHPPAYAAFGVFFPSRCSCAVRGLASPAPKHDDFVGKRSCIAAGLVAPERQSHRQQSVWLLSREFQTCICVIAGAARQRLASFQFWELCADQISPACESRWTRRQLTSVARRMGCPHRECGNFQELGSSLDVKCMQALDPTDLAHTVCPRAPDCHLRVGPCSAALQMHA
jgi:hypothetical protein